MNKQNYQNPPLKIDKNDDDDDIHDDYDDYDDDDVHDHAGVNDTDGVTIMMITAMMILMMKFLR